MTESHDDARRRSLRKPILTVLVVLLALFVVYQLYGLLASPDEVPQRPGAVNAAAAASSPIQLDVLNGCGAAGVGQKMTGFLRSRGYDVVEMGNYKSFDVKQSLVIDRSGDLTAAKRIAADLGIAERNVLQQISPGYFVTASVVIGKDYAATLAWK